MKKPFPRWLVIQATSITPTTPAPASGVSRPRIRRAAAPTSVRLAVQAWRIPGFMPRLSNQRAGPGDLAAAEDVIDAVGHEDRGHTEAQDQQGEVDGRAGALDRGHDVVGLDEVHGVASSAFEII